MTQTVFIPHRFHALNRLFLIFIFLSVFPNCSFFTHSPSSSSLTLQEVPTHLHYLSQPSHTQRFWLWTPNWGAQLTFQSNMLHIQSTTAPIPLADSRAFQSRLLHLWDALSSMRFSPTSFPLSHSTLNRLGLLSPLYTLRFQTKKGMYWLKIGNVSSQPQGSFFQITLPSNKTVTGIGNGSFFRILNHFQKLTDLRNPFLLHFPQDQVQSMRISFHLSHSSIQIERAGYLWIHPKGKKYPISFTFFLKQLFSLSIQAWNQKTFLKTLKKKKKLFSITLFRRKHPTYRLSIYQGSTRHQKSVFYASSPLYPHALWKVPFKPLMRFLIKKVKPLTTAY